MTTSDRSARAALWGAYLHHGVAAFAPGRHDRHAADYRRCLLLGWMWEPRAGALAITPAGLDVIRPFLPPDRTATPTEAAE